jgi:hypothetical protein
MNKLVALLFYIAFANVLLIGQTTTPLIDRVERSSKRFRPELAAPVPPSGPATLFGSNCVYRSKDAKSLSVEPCRKDDRKFRLVPPAKPERPPDR